MRRAEQNPVPYIEPFDRAVLHIANRIRLVKEMLDIHEVAKGLHFPSSVLYRHQFDLHRASQKAARAIGDRLAKGEIVVVNLPTEGRVIGIRKVSETETETIDIARFSGISPRMHRLQDARVIAQFQPDGIFSLSVQGKDSTSGILEAVTALSGKLGNIGFTVTTKQEVLVGQAGVKDGKTGLFFGKGDISNPYDEGTYRWLVTGKQKEKKVLVRQTE